MEDTHALVIGEALIDIVETAQGARELVGGSSANVAVGLARQGLPVRLHTRIGRDARGAMIAEHVASAGVALTAPSWSDAATSTARAAIQPDGSARYTFDIDWSVPAPSLDGAALVHAGSIGLFLQPGGDTVLAALEGAGDALVTLDPNIRADLVGDHAAALAHFERAAAAADLVKLSDEDAAWLYPGASAERVLEAIAAHGVRAVVMTRGADGVLALGPSGLVEVAALPVTVADTIGAGDAYMASLVFSALDDASLLRAPDAFEWALRRAAVTAGITVSREGADPPRRGEVDRVVGFSARG
ncbi:PfkB family carbohydrate kinase [Microbacterium sp. W1N]|uniref:PfkB family carbohydrate kinase n=1 Tax=Microbacterium festucae TaxID=2977531 RepID=UPI0021C21869|nr:PfkB family carbohydrate kinase [Microbacterium festucae]MCT9819068.1 PfkB family carbohydrate kinase [Microbacterium festucae]